MKTLACLFRRTSMDSTCRRTFGNANMVKRKDLRRAKRINIYNKQISGDSNPNAWFVPKRLKAMANQIETSKNNHVGTNPIDPEIQKELLKIMPGLAEYQYYNFRNRQQQLTHYNQFVDQCNIEEWINKLPAKLRKDIQAAETNPLPEISEPLLKYTEQLQVYLPLDERHRYNLMLKIKHPPKIKLDADETEN